MSDFLSCLYLLGEKGKSTIHLTQATDWKDPQTYTHTVTDLLFGDNELQNPGGVEDVRAPRGIHPVTIVHKGPFHTPNRVYRDHKRTLTCLSAAFCLLRC